MSDNSGSKISNFRTRARVDFYMRSNNFLLRLKKFERKGFTFSPAYSQLKSKISSSEIPEKLAKILPFVSRISAFVDDFESFFSLISLHPAFLKAVNSDKLLCIFLNSKNPKLVPLLDKTQTMESYKFLIKEVSLYQLRAIESVRTVMHHAIRSIGRQELQDALSTFFLGDEFYKFYSQKIGKTPQLSLFGKIERDIELKKVFLELYGGSTQVLLQFNCHREVMSFGVKAMKLVQDLRACYKDEKKFVLEIRPIEAKIDLRLKMSSLLLNPFMFVRHSHTRFPGLQLGSVLDYEERSSPSIFSSSKIIITSFEVGLGVEGIIFNKRTSRTERSKPIYLGGPCDEDELIFLHKDGNVPGATKIIEGLFLGGLDLDSMGSEREVKICAGKAGWFWGQLDGELFGRVWRLRNDVTVEEVMREYDESDEEDDEDDFEMILEQ